MLPWTSNFILQLCLDGSILPYYRNKLVNNMSSKDFLIAHNPANDLQKSSGPIIVRDIPDFINVKASDSGLVLLKVPHYKGFLINLEGYNDIDEYIGDQLGKNSRNNLRGKLRNLELKHDIKYEYYYGEIDKNHYEYLFEVCYQLMESRFSQKEIHNRYLLDWKYYFNLFYPKILKKEASLFVIYDKDKPITLTLNFHHADIVFSFMQIYDTDYYKFSMGNIAMYRNLQWAFKNKFTIWDVSKGVTQNKLQWSNYHYLFDYHIFYDSKSLKAKFLVKLATKKLKFKQYLRDKGIIGGLLQLDRLYYYTKRKKLKIHDWKN